MMPSPVLRTWQHHHQPQGSKKDVLSIRKAITPLPAAWFWISSPILGPAALSSAILAQRRQTMKPEQAPTGDNPSDAHERR